MIVILNRLSGPLAEYYKWIPEGREVCFLYNSEGKIPLELLPRTWITRLIDNFDETEVLIETISRILVGQKISAVVAASENVLQAGAKIRAHFDVAGSKWPEDSWIVDKTVMQTKLDTFFPVIPSLQMKSEYCLKARAKEAAALYGFPFVAKPKSSSASQGVLIFSNQDILDKFLDSDVGHKASEAIALFQPFLEGDIYHIDGAVWDGTVVLSLASKYYGNCLDFYQKGSPLGSIVVDKSLQIRLKICAQGVVAALAYQNGVFHLELIYHRGEFYFLEIAPRVGGGLIPQVFEQVSGFYLPRIATEIECGIFFLKGIEYEDKFSAGFLMIPVNPLLKNHSLVQVVFADFSLPKPKELVRIHVSKPGSLIPSKCFYPSWAKFEFSGDSVHEVENAIVAVAKSFRYECSVPEFYIG